MINKMHQTKSLLKLKNGRLIFEVINLKLITPNYPCELKY